MTERAPGSMDRNPAGRLALPGRQARNAATVSGSAAVVFSLPFIGVGLFAVLSGLGLTPVDLAGRGIPPVGMLIVGGIFLSAGLALMLNGIRAIFRQRRYAALIRENPDQPWLADYPWDPDGFADNKLGRIMQTVMGLLFFIMFLAPFNYFVFVAPQHDMPLFVKGVILFFDLIPVLLAWHTVYLYVQWWKYGTPFITFDRFPFRPGETVSVKFGTTRDIGAFRSLAFTLRCIEEVREVHGTGKNRSERIVCCQIYADARTLDNEGELHPHIEPIALTFDLPAGVPVTALCTAPPRYWEIEVKADTPGIDFYAAFLVPVYDAARA